MNAAVVHALGQAPRYEQFPDPVAEDGEVVVRMRAAGLHPIVKALVSGQHYGSTNKLPLIAGLDGAGVLDDGTRVYCGMPRAPYGTMAEKTVVPKSMCVPLPAGLDDAVAAAIANPGMSAWLSLTWRARLARSETVLILGATGTAGRLAVQLAKHLGAGRVIAVGRNPESLRKAQALGADAILSLEQPQTDLVEALVHEVKTAGIDVVIDYLWGRPTEAVIEAVSQKGLSHAAKPVRLVEVGASAGGSITLPAAALRSSGLEISGSGFGSASMEQIMKAVPEILRLAASGKLHIDIAQAPLSQVEAAWTRPTHGARLVITP